MSATALDPLFAGTTVLVTGASSGLGEEFARQLAARRANLILTARSTEKLEALAKELSGAHAIRADVITNDLGAADGAAALCAELDRRSFAVDHLVSNAGFGTNGPFTASDGARQGEMVRVNCEALTVLSHHVLPRMIEKRAGGILHVASVAGMQPVPFMATYGATKAYVLSLSVALTEELRGTGVRCSALCPGPVPTGFQQVAGSGIAPSQRAATMTAAEVVTIGLRAYARGQAVCIPGAINRIQAFGSWIAPRSILVRAVGRMMRAKGRASTPA